MSSNAAAIAPLTTPTKKTAAATAAAAASSDDGVKLILVTGSVISGVGKGVITSSLGLLLRAHGYRISVIKIDPYLNIDAGTFSPFEHGEVFVLDDGGEVDLDFGNYERFLGLRFTRENNITGGKIIQHVLNKERAGDYRGQTVQLIPHVTREIVEWVEKTAAKPVDGSNERPDICILELGGQVGDIEGEQFLKAFGDHFMKPRNRHRLMNVHVSLLVGTHAEPQKTKPMQRGVSEVRKYGLVPDLLMVRDPNPISDKLKSKIAGFAHLEEHQIIDCHDVSSTLQVPLLLDQQGTLQAIKERLNLTTPASGGSPFFSLQTWERLVACTQKSTENVRIALVGKYVSSRDAYKSVSEALTHAGIYCNQRVDIDWIESEHLIEINHENVKDANAARICYEHAWSKLKNCSGILVPGGFDIRGVEGMIVACEFARTSNIPYFGICLGMQCAVIEFARNVCGLDGANSTEFADNLAASRQVVIEMPEHAIANGGFGATMRLGRRSTVFLTQNSILRQIYERETDRNAIGGDECGRQRAIVEERHRHRYEVNPAHVPTMMQA